MLQIAVFGLGEAGALISADLAAGGATVAAFDPASVPTPLGVTRVDNPVDAVNRADVILAITSEADAVEAIGQALDAIHGATLYADLSTSFPGVKRELAAVAGSRKFDFVDVALMAMVPGNGLRTPALASGPGATRFVATFKPLGMPVEAISDSAGDAATRKLLRSVMMKGLASVVIEALRAGHAAGCADWLWKNIADQLTVADESVLRRLVSGTGVHALRRLHEMKASLALLNDLGIDPVMTRSTVESHQQVLDHGVPSIPQMPMRSEDAAINVE